MAEVVPSPEERFSLALQGIDQVLRDLQSQLAGPNESHDMPANDDIQIKQMTLRDRDGAPRGKHAFLRDRSQREHTKVAAITAVLICCLQRSEQAKERTRKQVNKRTSKRGKGANRQAWQRSEQASVTQTSRHGNL